MKRFNPAASAAPAPTAASVARVAAVAPEVTTVTLIETQHTKLKHKLFAVQLGTRVDRAHYEHLNRHARALGGYYSRYRRDGAIPGFLFTMRDQAEQFITIASTALGAPATRVGTEAAAVAPAPRRMSMLAALKAAAGEHWKVLDDFIGPGQRAAIEEGCRGEEKEFFFEKLKEYAERIATMPQTYDQDGKGEEAIVYLHYFAGGQANFWITEKDRGTPGDEGQHQAFGLADLFHDGGELGYISIAEIIENGGELDLYFTPCPLNTVRKGQEPDASPSGEDGRAEVSEPATVVPTLPPEDILTIEADAQPPKPPVPMRVFQAGVECGAEATPPRAPSSTLEPPAWRQRFTQHLGGFVL